MSKAVLALLAVLALTTPGAAGDDDEGERPELHLRATPKFAFSPATILFIAELKGGDDVEELYCPEVEWDWGDGGRSVNESDCDPWEPGMEIERRYTERHVFQYSGRYVVQVIFRRAGKRIMRQTVAVTVRRGAGEPTIY